MLELGAIDFDYRAGISKQNLRSGFHDMRLSRTRRTQEEKVAYGTLGRVQPRAKDLVQFHQRLDTLLLSHDHRLQSRFKFRRLRTA